MRPVVRVRRIYVALIYFIVLRSYTGFCGAQAELNEADDAAGKYYYSGDEADLHYKNLSGY